MKLSRKVRSERALSPSRGCAPGWSEAPSAAVSALRPPSTNCNSSQDFHDVRNSAGLCSECGTCCAAATPAAWRHPDLLPAPSPAIHKLQQSYERPLRNSSCSRTAGCGLAKQQFALGRECGCYKCAVHHKMRQPLKNSLCAHSSQQQPRIPSTRHYAEHKDGQYP